MIKFTVVTICCNEAATIERTMKSVLAQDDVEIEYLIIDGQSKDNTINIAEKTCRENADRNIQIFSEKDFGIYNAMNRGIVRSTGDYVIFLNAGDVFCDSRVLKRAAYYIKKYGYGIYYGIAYKVCGNKIVGTFDYGNDKRSDLIKLLNAYAPNHQATIAPLSCLKRFYFDESYLYCADLDWFIKCYKSGMRLINMNYPVCKFDMSGISHRASIAVTGRNDICKMLKRQFPILGRLAVLLMDTR